RGAAEGGGPPPSPAPAIRRCSEGRPVAARGFGSPNRGQVLHAMAMSPGPPHTAEEVLDLFEQGKLSPAEAFSLFRRLHQTGKVPAVYVPAAAAPRAKAREEDDEAE